MPELSKNRRFSFFFLSLSLSSFTFARIHASSVLPFCHPTTVPVRRRVNERRREKEKKKKKSERCRKKRRGKKNVNIEQNRVQLTGQILEPMKQVYACACILFHSLSLSPSIFSISCTHARTSEIFFFKYILFDT